MGLYLIGDVQGCDEALGRLLAEIDFSASKDQLVVLGDLVNRGPDSLGVLRRLKALGHSAQCLLGNHDLHALAVAVGARSQRRSDTLTDILLAPDAQELLEWLRWRDMAVFREGILMVHAGVLPDWEAAKTVALGAEVASAIRQNDSEEFFRGMYGSLPAAWDEALKGTERLRVIVNALTRLRFCTVRGEMEFSGKGGAQAAPVGYMPWFDVPGRATANTTVAFGHWSALGLLQRRDLISLDTGCVWGGCLSAMRVDAGRRELVQVKCEQTLAPGEAGD